MSLFIIFSIVSILLISIVGILISLYFHKKNVYTTLFLDAIIGGIFFGVGFLYLLSNSIDFLNEKGYHGLNLATMLAGATMLVLLIISQVTRYNHQMSMRSTALLMWIILSAHSLFLGIFLGVQSYIFQMVTPLFLIVIVHKFGGVFILANKVNKAFSHVVTWILLLLFMGITPLGIIIGVSVQPLWVNFRLEEALLNAIAAGAFIYMGAEIKLFPATRTRRFTGIISGLLLLVGFGVMYLLTV